MTPRDNLAPRLRTHIYVECMTCIMQSFIYGLKCSEANCFCLHCPSFHRQQQPTLITCILDVAVGVRKFNGSQFFEKAYASSHMWCDIK